LAKEDSGGGGEQDCQSRDTEEAIIILVSCRQILCDPKAASKKAKPLMRGLRGMGKKKKKTTPPVLKADEADGSGQQGCSCLLP